MPHTISVLTAFSGRLTKPYGVDLASSGSGVAFGHATAPFITAYPWTTQVGFGTKFANPATAFPGQVNGITFNSLGTVLFAGHNAGSLVSAYAWSNAGFGTKFANPATSPNGPGTSITFRPFNTGVNDNVAMSDNDVPTAVFLNAWRFSKTGAGWGTKFTNPATVLTGTGLGAQFSPNGLNLAFSHATSPFVTAYPWTDAGFGVKYANPAVLAPLQGNGVSFQKSGAAVSICHAFSTTNVTAWAFASGFGVKYANASYVGGYADTGLGIAVTSQAVNLGQTLSASFDQNIAWRWTDALGFGTRYGTLARIPAAVQALAYNLSETDIFRSISVVGTRISARRWTNASGFGTAYSQPATLPTGTVVSVAVAP